MTVRILVGDVREQLRTLAADSVDCVVTSPPYWGLRANGKGDGWFQDGAASHGSKSKARKAASAMIAKIPLPVSRHVGRCFVPTGALRGTRA